LKHLIFIFVDHFEPSNRDQVETWTRQYPRFAKRFEDAAGNRPRHTWFYDGEDPFVLSALGRLCSMKLGEIEIHLHHGRDTAQGLRETLEKRKRLWAGFGALVTPGPGPTSTFGFIHGKWSLDNSRGEEFCGVNNELTVLREAGCYADFTFPAWGRMQPAKRSSIYYAKDDPKQPKSYDTGQDVEAGRPPSGDLLIFEGPGRFSGIPRSPARIPGLARLADRIWLTCALDGHLPPWPDRVDRWVREDVTVKGRPEWVFVKVHTHGARPDNYPVYFGEWAERLYTYLGMKYNDGRQWKLHYATAREAYNMVKAAEAEKVGDPEEYRNYVIAPYLNTK
jgi:hypothetical protein